VLKDISAFERLVNSSRYAPTFETKNDLNSLSYDDHSKLVWNKEYALLITIYYTGQEYSEWGNDYTDYDDYYYQDYESTDAVEAIEEQLEPRLEEMTEEEWKAYIKEKDGEKERKKKEREEKKKKQQQEKAERDGKRKAIEALELDKRITQFFSDQLLNNAAHLQLELDEDAAATFWYPNYTSFLEPFFYSAGYGFNPYTRYGIFSGMFGMSNFFSGGIVANGYLEENHIRLDMKMKYYGNLEEIYAAIFKQKIDKSFGNFLTEKDLGFASLSVNTEEILNEYPKLIEGMMSIYDTSYNEEYKLFAELFSICVDEKAISELITGDALFIMNDLGMKKVTKYTYKYDEEYNYERVLTTQMELTPDFSFISGTNRPDIVEKFVNLGLKYALISATNDGYKFEDKFNDFPISAYFTYTDNHMIFTSDAAKMSAYKALSKGNAVKDKKNLLLKNNGAFYLNAKELVSKILSSDIGDRDKRMFLAMESEISTIQASMKHEKGGNHIIATAPVPETEANGAKYLLHFFNKMILAEKRR
jgi:hypothetical protein